MSSEIVPVPDHLQKSLSRFRHDVRTPLNHIIGLSDLWLDQLPLLPETEELKADLQSIRDAGWKLHDMLTTLLAKEGIALEKVEES